jgi:uridine phosphorylase
MDNKYCITSEDVVKKAIQKSGKSFDDFKVNPNIIIFFSSLLLDILKKRKGFQENEWLVPYHPYATSKIYNMEYRGISITAISPPMGASPLASVCEDLIFCGAQNILLVCGSWGIGKNVKLLDFIIPTHSLGLDGTSKYYDNKFLQSIKINDKVVNILSEIAREITSKVHLGKNFSFEAFYRIQKEKINQLRKKGVISIENGELNVLSKICKEKGLKFGCIFYSYINLLEGWNVPWLESVKYRETVAIESNIALKTLLKLSKL